MVGTIQQKLYIRAIPPGMGFRVTALNLLPPSPAEEWRATLYDSAERERHAPFFVDPNVEGGYLGVVKMYGAHAFPINSDGARLEILWELTDNATNAPLVSNTDQAVDQANYEHPPLADQPKEPAPTIDPKDPTRWPTRPAALTIDARAAASVSGQPTRTGRLLVETTYWGLIQRPDYVSVLYQVGSETPLRITSEVAATIISQPQDALFLIGVNKEDQRIAINATQDTDVANVIASSLLEGIFYVHEKAFGWVFGNFLPF
ncbi:hypothetical protein C0993_008711 [Termitomyces sp. T159_Od127]|nr:hypothetical protein C0993_008711 [Termitomyces sp. T159_Od127]